MIPAKSLNKTFSLSDMFLKAASISASEYLELWYRIVGPSPVANQCALTERTRAAETKFSADRLGSFDFSHLLMICGDTPIFEDKASGVEYPPVDIACFSLSPKRMIFLRLLRTDILVIDKSSSQYLESKVSFERPHNASSRWLRLIRPECAPLWPDVFKFTHTPPFYPRLNRQFNSQDGVFA